MSDQRFSAELSGDDLRNLELWLSVANECVERNTPTEGLSILNKLINRMNERGRADVAELLKTERDQLEKSISVPTHQLREYLRGQGLIS